MKIVGFITTLLLLTPSFIIAQEFWHMMNGFGGYHMGWMGWIMMVLFWGVILFGVISIFRALMGKKDFSDSGDSALDILRERYAKGEISEEEFETKRKYLTTNH